MATLKTTILLGALTGLLLVVGRALGGTGGMVIAFAFAILMNGGAYWFSDKLALRMAGAREITPDEAPDLHRLVAELAQRAHLPTPRVYVVDADAPNAFATERNPAHGVVAVTTGIMRILDRDELAAVIAHELGHIKNRDTLISAVAATAAGAVTMIANMAQWTLIVGGLSSGEGEEDSGLAGLAGGLVMIIVAPLAATLIQLAISRAGVRGRRGRVADRRRSRSPGIRAAQAGAVERSTANGRRSGHGASLYRQPATRRRHCRVVSHPSADGAAHCTSRAARAQSARFCLERRSNIRLVEERTLDR